MKCFALVLLALPLLAQASDLDQKLQGYITQFQLKSLKLTDQRDPNLFRLGQMLFMNRAVSGNNNISCVECHHPAAMTTDMMPLSIGEGAEGIQVNGRLRKQAAGVVNARNTIALFNIGKLPVVFWDGRISFDAITGILQTPVTALNGPQPKRIDVTKHLQSAVAAQAIFPLITHIEMRGAKGSNPIADAKDEMEAWDLLVEKLISLPLFQRHFEAAFPGEKINIGHVGAALAEFQKFAFNYADTPYDRYLDGDLMALTESQKKGMDVFFNKGKCGECHNGEHLSNFEFHNVGVPQIGPGQQNGDDFGRYQWDPKPENLYAFRVPPLRNVGLTAPYMHNGVYESLLDVVNHYGDVTISLRAFELDRSFDNYVQPLKTHDHRTDEKRIASLSPKVQKFVLFSEAEGKDLIDFLSTALTDVKLLR
jgi:cytochrome c peroxidase